MGKKQKSKNEDNAKDDIDIDALAAEIEGAGASKPTKAGGKKKKKKDFDEDDILKELEELSMENQEIKDVKETAKSSAANVKQKEENDDESESFNAKQDKKKNKSSKAKKPSFEEEDEMEDEEFALVQNKKGQNQKSSLSDEDKPSKKSKGKNPKPTQKLDLSEDEVQMTKGEANSLKDSDDEESEFPQKKKGKKKDNQKGKPPQTGESDGDDDDDEEEEPTFKLKTAAQKKAEKKERERKKREEEKAKLRKLREKEESEQSKKEKDQQVPSQQEPENAPAPPTEIKGGEVPLSVEGDENDGEKKKKDKKKKKEKDEKEKKKAGPSKAVVKAMQEALARLKEEEERQKREEEERIRRLEEMEAKRLEQEKLEQERKEKRKQKEKERKERLKKEGKLLTKTQKEAKARAEARLELLRAQGIEVPSKDSMPKKRPIYEDKKKKKQHQENKEDECKDEPLEVSPTPAVEEVEVIETQIEASQPTPVVEEEKDVGLDDWEAMASDHEQEMKTIHIELKEKAEEEEAEEDDDEEEDENEEDGESNESEDEEDKGSDETRTVSQKKLPEVEKSSRQKPTQEFSSESDSESNSEDGRTKEERIYDDAKRRIEKRRAENTINVNYEKLRAPIICVLGHVDTGKTKILDKLRHTHVQDGEAGGITQQIGATNVPLDTIKEQTKMVKNFDKDNIKIPGMLIIDTPGHESFSNLRNRGSSLCDIAILVVDVMHGLEPQTIESINLLKTKKCPFIVALNKIDRLYDWKKSPETDVVSALKKQKKNTKDEFDERAKSIIVEFAQQGLNASLFYENKDPRTFVSLVPTSAHSGDGMGNLIALLAELTQTMLAKRLAYSLELRAQVMEVKALPGMGTTIDVILINGQLKEGDTIIVPGVEGPIVTQIRGLLLPPPLKELRVKNQYEKQKEVWAAQGVKILAKDLEKSLAGLPLLVANKDDEVAVLKDEIEHELKQTLSSIKLEDKGVYVQASTLGSLEALLEFLRGSSVPYAGINIGPVHKRDVTKASAMLEHDPQYSVILAFDVKIERDSQELADSLGVRIFSAEIIYHLFDAFTKYRQDYKRLKQEEFKHIAVFPSKIRILPQFIFNSRDPIVVGVTIEAGILKQGTPVCVPAKNFVDIGIVTSIEVNHKQVEVARKGQEVCIKIEPIPGEAPKMFGRHFEATDFIVSKISRQSIDALKDWFRDEMQKSDWQLIVELKKTFEII
ncbi:LOW QUALITY PROTEIN: eukaryotic translation initiation factor 5B [Callorhinchus milii]|uniref:LOW QUALITY PROTEIN: eukaryotic translation initiation factor 5B n=1 Tax=Callorhinchus milii TaxID=7868 RepID=UPI001C3FEA1A|nr:LOW QUALITY PROTEIN: eukaryotic translation initiation factor 5B [Callorhinchus milii]